MKWGLIALVAVLVLAMIPVGAWGIRWVTADFRGQLSAREEILSGSNRIAAYNHFFNLCSSIQGNEAQIDALETELETAEGKDKSRVQASLTGVRAAREGAIARYNADSRRDYTIGQFRDLDLPYQLPTEPYASGGKTSCGSG